jgi:hypothetical protein
MDISRQPIKNMSTLLSSLNTDLDIVFAIDAENTKRLKSIVQSSRSEMLLNFDLLLESILKEED